MFIEIFSQVGASYNSIIECDNPKNPGIVSSLPLRTLGYLHKMDSIQEMVHPNDKFSLFMYSGQEMQLHYPYLIAYDDVRGSSVIYDLEKGKVITSLKKKCHDIRYLGNSRFVILGNNIGDIECLYKIEDDKFVDIDDFRIFNRWNNVHCLKAYNGDIYYLLCFGSDDGCTYMYLESSPTSVYFFAEIDSTLNYKELINSHHSLRDENGNSGILCNGSLHKLCSFLGYNTITTYMIAYHYREIRVNAMYCILDTSSNKKNKYLTISYNSEFSKGQIMVKLPSKIRRKKIDTIHISYDGKSAILSFYRQNQNKRINYYFSFVSDNVYTFERLGYTGIMKNVILDKNFIRYNGTLLARVIKFHPDIFRYMPREKQLCIAYITMCCNVYKIPNEILFEILNGCI